MKISKDRLVILYKLDLSFKRLPMKQEVLIKSVDNCDITMSW